MLLLPAASQARTITVNPGDNYSGLEQAVAGDIVEIAPGTYSFPVRLAKIGTAQNPITIRAKDPSNRPVFDYSGRDIGSLSGSYTGPDRDRAAWRVEGQHYVFENLVFRGARGPNVAPLWLVRNWDGKGRPSATFRHCLFVDNTNGIMGMGDFVIESCEFDDNGRKPGDGGNAAHNMYLFGGTLVMRYSYLHDPVEGQNFHLRGYDNLLEYNLIESSASYPGDLMTCEYYCGGSGNNGVTQTLNLVGNVITQGNTSNKFQVVVLFNDSGPEDDTGRADRFEVNFIHNTIIGTAGSGGSRNLVNLENSGDHSTHATFYNNIIVDLTDLYTVDTPSSNNWSVKGAGNCVTQNTTIGQIGATVLGGTGSAAAGLTKYQLTGGPCVGTAQALPSGMPKPTREYVAPLSSRARATNRDPGAYESGQAPPVTDGGPPPSDAGPPPPGSDGSPPTSDSGAWFDGAGSSDSGSGNPQSGPTLTGGCSLGDAPAIDPRVLLFVLAAAAAALLTARRARSRRR